VTWKRRPGCPRRRCKETRGGREFN
jgi:hypothetical protein